jgi:3-oxoacyl-[acyl-carrier protein] reductase
MNTRVALVTGGAGGIGKVICERLSKAEYSVVVAYKSKKAQAETLSNRIGGIALCCDVTDSSSLDAAVKIIEERFGRLDLLVNNAGTTQFVPHDNLDALDDALFDRIMITNARGAFASIRACRGLLEKSDQAAIVNISSVAARSGIGSNVAYCASKAALDSITRSLGRALAPKIRVLSISPGAVDTDFIKGLDDSWRSQQVGRTPMSRLATPEEVAEAVLAAARLFTFTTGSVLPIDGGRRLA